MTNAIQRFTPFGQEHELILHRLACSVLESFFCRDKASWDCIGKLFYYLHLLVNKYNYSPGSATGFPSTCSPIVASQHGWCQMARYSPNTSSLSMNNPIASHVGFRVQRVMYVPLEYSRVARRLIFLCNNDLDVRCLLARSWRKRGHLWIHYT